jgi:hypothetical protein
MRYIKEIPHLTCADESHRLFSPEGKTYIEKVLCAEIVNTARATYQTRCAQGQAVVDAIALAKDFNNAPRYGEWKLFFCDVVESVLQSKSGLKVTREEALPFEAASRDPRLPDERQHTGAATTIVSTALKTNGLPVGTPPPLAPIKMSDWASPCRDGYVDFVVRPSDNAGNHSLSPMLIVELKRRKFCISYTFSFLFWNQVAYYMLKAAAQYSLNDNDLAAYILVADLNSHPIGTIREICISDRYTLGWLREQLPNKKLPRTAKELESLRDFLAIRTARAKREGVTVYNLFKNDSRTLSNPKASDGQRRVVGTVRAWWSWFRSVLPCRRK